MHEPSPGRAGRAMLALMGLLVGCAAAATLLALSSAPAAAQVGPQIELAGGAHLTVLQGESFADPGASAWHPEDGNLSDQIEVWGDVDTGTPGEYVLTYSVTDSNGNTASVTRHVTVRPNNPPSITLLGEAEMTLLQGHAFEDPGATAEDPEDGDLTDQIQVSGSVAPGTPGEYVLTYGVTDSDGNSASATRIVIVAPNNPPTITLLGETEMTVLEGQPFEDPGATAEDPEDGDLTDQILVAGTVDTATPGTYFLEYSVTDSDGNTATAERRVVGRANQPPTVALRGENPMTILAGTAFVDPGATADDPEDGDLTGQIEVSGHVDSAVAGEYTLVYSVTDSDGNSASAERLVIVTPNNPPTITLLGANPLILAQGSAFEDPGAVAEDPEDGDLTSKIEVLGEVDTSSAGEYTLTYSVADSDGNTASATRRVLVQNNPPELIRPIEAPNATESVPYQSVNDGRGFSLDDFFRDPDGDELFYEVDFGPWPDGLPESRRLRVDADGSETGVRGLIHGTPQREDASDDGPRVVTVIVRDRADPSDPQARRFEGTFELTIEALGRADLSLSLDATPDPAPLDAEVTWRLTVANASSTVTVDQARVEGQLAGAAFSILHTNGGCHVHGRAFECTAGPVPPMESVSVELTGRAVEAGDLLLSASTEIPQATGFEPIDPNPNNNAATRTLSVGRSFSPGPAYTLSAPSASRALAAGDLTGDGFTDLVLGTASGHATRIYLSRPLDPGDAQGREARRFAEPTLLDDATHTHDVLLADLTNDGILDLVLANGRLDGSPQPNYVFLNAGGSEPALSLSVTLGNSISHAVAAADLSGNGLLDLAFANAGDNAIHLNDGAGSFRTVTALGAGDSRAMVIADFDGDLLPDVVIVDADGPSRLHRNLGIDGQGVPRFADPVAITDAPMTSVRAVDLNGNGLPDLVFGRDRAEAPSVPANPVYINIGTPGAPAFIAASGELGASPTLSLATADLHGDGIVDVITLNATGTHQIFRGAGDASFTLQAQQFSSARPAGTAADDFNNNGRPDLAVARDGGIDVFLNDGRGNLGPGDTEPPVIELRGEPSVSLTVGSVYQDAGATASDAVDGDLTHRIVVDNPVNPDVIGTYTVTYNVRDLSGNAAVPVTRTVTVGAQQEPAGGGGGAATGLLPLMLLLLIALKLSTHRRPSRRDPSCARPFGA